MKNGMPTILGLSGISQHPAVFLPASPLEKFGSLLLPRLRVRGWLFLILLSLILFILRSVLVSLQPSDLLVTLLLLLF